MPSGEKDCWITVRAQAATDVVEVIEREGKGNKIDNQGLFYTGMATAKWSD